MRILGFSKEWAKLKQDTFTTFRLPRKDTDKGRDWAVGEIVQIVYQPRSKNRKILGRAKIFGKEPRGQYPQTCELTEAEVIEDGFESLGAFWEYMAEAHGIPTLVCKGLNKLTLRWVER